MISDLIAKLIDKKDLTPQEKQEVISWFNSAQTIPADYNNLVRGQPVIAELSDFTGGRLGTVDSGHVGGVEIGEETLTFGTGTVGMQSEADPAIYAGDATPASAEFRVNHDGAMFASSATITGAVTATSGAIGGFVVDATSVKDAAGAVGLSSAVTGGDDIRLWAGNSTPASAPFKVTEAGSLTASSGQVGGWNLGASELKAGTGTDTVGLDSGGTNPAIYAGSATPGAAPFRVTKAGDMTANTGSIGGWSIVSTVIQKFASAAIGIILDAANAIIKVGNTAGVHFQLDGANSRFRTSNYSAGVAGFNIDGATGDAEFNNLTARGKIKSVVFEKDTLSAIGGNFAVLNADVLNADMTAADASTLTIVGDSTFAVGDILRIKDGIDDEWLEVTNIGSAPTYTVTRDKAAAYTADNNPVWKKGQAVVSYGASGEGGILEVSGSDPYFSLFTHAGSPWTSVTEHIRLSKAGVAALAGALVLDQRGIYATILSDIITQIADDGATYRKGRLGMFTLQGATAPAFGMNYQDNSVQTNLVTNGDFETADFTGWTAVSGSDWTVPVGGGYHARCAGTGEKKQIFDVSPTTIYSLSFRGGCTVGTTAKITLDWYSATGGGGSLLASDDILVTTAPWATFTKVRTSPATAASVAVRMRFTGSSLDVGVWDDIVFEVVPVANYAGFDPTTGSFITQSASISGALAVGGDLTVTGNVQGALVKSAGGGLFVTSDGGGITGYVSITGAVAGVSTGSGTVKMSGSTARNSTGWLKIYVNTDARYIPYWTTISG